MATAAATSFTPHPLVFPPFIPSFEAQVVSVALSFAIFGVFCSEAAKYVAKSGNDRRVYKIWVLALFLVDGAAVFLNTAWVVANNVWARSVAVFCWFSTGALFYAWSGVFAGLLAGKELAVGADQKINIAANYSGLVSILVIAGLMSYRLWLTRRAFRSDSANALTRLLQDGLITSAIALAIQIVACVACTLPQTQAAISAGFICVNVFPLSVCVSVVWSLNRRSGYSVKDPKLATALNSQLRNVSRTGGGGQLATSSRLGGGSTAIRMPKSPSSDGDVELFRRT
ncbi:hypothetical protein MNV49_003182 [Pseudohyphozyma bogoriensis]|nr:hypothetical protein MNV49_003182 [Pseudohyphozyma bogoriensis]